MVGHLKPVNYKVGIFILCGFFLLLFLFGDHSSEVNLQSPDLVAKEVVSKSISTSDITVTKILSNVTSGQEFNGKRFRTFQGVKRFENVEDLEVKQQRKSKWNCSKWGVVTTIFPPSESVRRFLYRDDWCVVVVGDKDKPQEYRFDYTRNSHNIVFLSSADQMALDSPFVQNLPWNTFGRKNVGYLYAISQGAKVIWDFDDDNLLKFWLKRAAPDDVLEIDSFIHYQDLPMVQPQSEQNQSVFNPYPVLGSSNSNCWPRGFPLDSIQKQKPQNQMVKVPKDEKTVVRFGVLQSLADFQPDVDAIFRLTQKTPFHFKRPDILKLHGGFLDKFYSKPILRIPPGTYSPYNAQASLHFYDAFWGLYLPVTVAGRVSDIWRSYFTQYFFKYLNLNLGFLPRPLVSQDRNPHSYLADFQAELPLYTKTSKLVEFLQNYEQETDVVRNVPERMENLWIQLYERGYIEFEDVIHVQNWIQALLDVGYTFPKMRPISQVSQLVSPTFYQQEALDSKLHKVQECHTNQEVIFGNADLHEGTRSNFASALSHVNQTIALLGLKGKIQNYPEINEMPGVHPYPKLSALLRKYNDHSFRVKPAWIFANHEYFQDDKIYKRIDAYICGFPASMCQLWLPFNSSKIVIMAAHRYNLGRCTESEWKMWDSQLKELSSNKANTIAAVSRYDVEYMKYYTGIPSIKLIPSFSGYYITEEYRPTREEYLIFTVHTKVPSFINNVKKAIQPFKANFVYDQYQPYTPADLTNHPAIIFLPYSVMSYRFTEVYNMAIPLFVPSPRFYLNYIEKGRRGMGHDRTSTSEPYCHTDHKLEMKMRPEITVHGYSPNLDMFEDPESEMYWMQFADFYDWPYITYFDNYDHLKDLLENSDLKVIHENMKQEVAVREQIVSQNWCDIANRIK